MDTLRKEAMAGAFLELEKDFVSFVTRLVKGSANCDRSQIL